MKPNTKLIFFLLIGLSLFSCNKKNESTNLLKQAQESFETKPELSLVLLDSIENPKNMDKDSYMQYIVAYIRAKSETRKDISSDTLIFEAQKYFEQQGDISESAIANYYAGQVCYANGMFPRSLEFYMYAVDQAKKANNSLLAVKSLNNIGYIYYERDILDSAINNFQKALSLYHSIESLEKNKSLGSLIYITTYTNIGRAFEDGNKLDSAYVYFNKALDKSVETNNEAFQFHSLKNLGVVCYGMENYDKAIDYFQSALNMDIKSEVDPLETSKINLYLLNIYNKKQDLKSAKQYADLVTVSLPKVTYKYTTKEIYAALTEYYEQTGNYKQALEYSKLEKATKEQIEKERNTPALLDADKNFYVVKNEREAQAFRSNALFIFIIIASAFCILLVIFMFVWRNHKKDQTDIKFYTDKYDELRESLYAHTDEYPKIEAEIKSMLEDD